MNFFFIFRCVLAMLETSYNVLLREASSDTQCRLVKSDSVASLTPTDNYDVSQAETIAVFCICVIAEIGNAKNNIIGVRHILLHN
jgi:hypothetical protein